MTERPCSVPSADSCRGADGGRSQCTPANETENASDNTFIPNCVQTELGEMNEIESRCPRCGDNGTTRLMITSIPHFKEIIVSSFECPHCGERNNEVTFGGQFGPKSVRYELQVKSKKDLDRQW
uniref:Uncharacterized protein TCIL3000_5_2800 n=1 Tax=Trypanosoma congolense (strain IL3000) TaxID=1068625 RepID=G0UN04_TRYCI|nr:unnamed protein product [Trypanosoma congolense IL3000]